MLARFAYFASVMDKPVITELIQNELNPERLKEELSKLLFSAEKKEQLLTDYSELWNRLGTLPASKQAAQEIVSLAKN